MAPEMTPGEMAILQQLADTARQQAVTSQEQAVLTSRLISVIEKLDEHLQRMDTEREKAVRGIKTALFVFAGIMGLAEILREPVGKLLALLH